MDIQTDETDILHNRLLSLVALRYESPDPRRNLRTANRAGRSILTRRSWSHAA
jgi:hypothetical protein